MSTAASVGGQSLKFPGIDKRQETEVLAEIQNPNQQGSSSGGGSGSGSMMGFLIVFALMLFAFEFWGPKKQQPSEKPPAVSSQQSSQENQSAAASQEAPSAVTAKPENVVNVVQAGSATETVVDSELYRVVFTNAGADVKSWVLKRYTDDNGKPLDLVNADGKGKFGQPLSLYAYDAGLRAKLNSSLYVPSATGTLQAPATLSFDYSAGGLTVHKTFSFDASYVIHADVSVTQNGAPVAALLAWPGGLGDQMTLQEYAAATFVNLENGKNNQVAAKKVSGGDTLHGAFGYAGVSDLYFAAVFMPDAPDDTSVVTFNNAVDIPRDRAHPAANATVPQSLLGAAVSQNGGELHTRLFAGPKLLEVLESVHPVGGGTLEPIVNFGIVWWISKPMLLVLRFFVTHGIPNWGWSILVLTLILNMAMLPTRYMMMRSSLKMQRIQPQMDAIKAKYSKFKTTDPRRQEMNQEIFDLQRREGVNMFGSCLPMLLQYPLLWGFYRMLQYAIELRHAHWLWLPDLSSADPTHILPIFVMVSMVMSQLFMPSPGVDQAQQRMMAFMMPAIFGVMMWSIGSGVALYWAGSNLIGVGQQLVMNRTSMGQEMRAIAAKRAAKKLGKPPSKK
jgi:YidC/Oxa1 family membrane protein insertase